MKFVKTVLVDLFVIFTAAFPISFYMDNIVYFIGLKTFTYLDYYGMALTFVIIIFWCRILFTVADTIKKEIQND